MKFSSIISFYAGSITLWFTSEFHKTLASSDIDMIFKREKQIDKGLKLY